jgi:uncharacterized NAD(P)/FAD-binding protein YdhS
MMPHTIAIIGGGFSGTILALNLLRTGPSCRVVLIERDHGFGRGIAYSATNPHHLLNVSAGGLSAFSDQPMDFVDWLETQPCETGTAPQAGTFAPRRQFGAYIDHHLAAALRDTGDRLALVQGNAVSVTREQGRWALQFATGQTVLADQVVIATGNPPPKPLRLANPGFQSSPAYRNNPWAADATTGLSAADPVLIIGTGLTMVDTVIDLLDAGHQGTIHGLSRHGLVPHRHVPMPPMPTEPPAPYPTTLVALTRRLRQDAAAWVAQGLPWQVAIEQFRPHVQASWRLASRADKSRFLRHMRSWWIPHRHRIAPAVADRIDDARRRGQLVITAGRIQSIRPQAGGLETAYIPSRGQGPVLLQAARVINCSGPGLDGDQGGDPLVRSMLDRGLVRQDDLRLGLEVTEDSALVGQNGQATPGLFALGPPTRGMFWEITAVPDIRLQAEQLAATITGAGQASAAQKTMSTSGLR